jgi:hypothetical protein
MTDREHDPDDLFGDVERRALFDLPDEDEEEPAPDLIAELGGDFNGARSADPAEDITLGGYIAKHQRVPAFDGSDGQPYTVDIDVEEDGTDAEAPFVAFLIFIRWAATGAGIMDHLESGDIARGATAEDAKRAVLELSLYEVKAELDAAIARRRPTLEE